MRTHTSALLKGLVAPGLVLTLTLGCSTGTAGDDGGQAADAGSDGPGADGGVLDDGGQAPLPIQTAAHHQSYIPPGFTPPAAARLLVMGDSIAAGYGASVETRTSFGPMLYEDDPSADFSEPGADLKTLYGDDLLYRQLGLPGATSEDLAAAVCAGCEIQDLFEQQETWPPEGHTIVAITIGGNDLSGSLFSGGFTGQLMEDALDNLAKVVAFLQDPANFPDGTTIYVATVYDPTDGEDHASACYFDVTVPDISAAINVWRERYIDLGKEMGFAVVDTLSHFRGHGWNYGNESNPFYDEDDPSLWFADCVHPNDQGHSEYRRVFFEAIDAKYVAD